MSDYIRRLVVWSFLFIATQSAWATWNDLPAMKSIHAGHTATLLSNGKILVAGGAVGNLISNTSELFDPTTGQWQTTGGMKAARLFHTATILHDGRVLVAGGSALSSAEIYDPETGVWTLTGSLNGERALHTATLLSNGRVLVAGGHVYSTNSSRNDAEIFDPVTNQWAWTGNLPYPCDGHAAAFMETGSVLISGGYQRSSGTTTVSDRSAEFNPATGRWTAAGLLPGPRVGHTMTLSMNTGKVIVAGGYDNNGSAVNTAALYEPSWRQWTATGNMTESRGNHTATRLANDNILIVGGHINTSPITIRSSAEIYNTSTGQWSLVDSPGLRTSHTATLLANGSVVVAGGTTAVGSDSSSVRRFSYAQGTWSNATALPVAATGMHPAATLLENGKVLLTGGSDYSSGSRVDLNKSWLYTPQSNTWASTGAMTSARSEHTATLLPNGKVLVAGGYVAGADLYDPTTGTWSPTGSPSIVRGRHQATLLGDGRVLFSGGEGNNANQRIAEIYDPASNAWSLTGDMGGNRYWHSATLLPNGKVLVAGGTTGSGDRLNSALLFDPRLGSWTPTANMINARYMHTATLLPNGKVLVAGGSSASSAELFDLDTGSWSPTGGLLISDHRAVLLQSGKVLVTLGSIAQVYDPMTGLWAPGGNPLNVTLSGHRMVSLPDGKVLVVGGSAPTNPLLFDIGLNYQLVSGRPYVDKITDPLYTIGAMSIGGFSYSLTAYSGPSSGNGSDSSSSQPIVQLQRLDNEQVFYAKPVDLWNSFYTSAAFNDLPVGHYRLTVFVNASPSESRLFVVVPPALPSAPTITKLLAGNGSINVYFVQPATGGLPTTYRASCIPQGSASPIHADGNSSPIKVSGLTNRLTYQCSVLAINSLGSGTSSSTMSRRTGISIVPILNTILD